MNWPTFDPVALGTLTISAAFGILVGFVTGWFSHRWSIRRQREAGKSIELRYWCQKLDDVKFKINSNNEQIPRPGLLLGAIERGTIEGQSPLQRMLVEQGIKAKTRIAALETELNETSGKEVK